MSSIWNFISLKFSKQFLCFFKNLFFYSFILNFNFLAPLLFLIDPCQSFLRLGFRVYRDWDGSLESSGGTKKLQFEITNKKCKFGKIERRYMEFNIIIIKLLFFKIYFLSKIFYFQFWGNLYISQQKYILIKIKLKFYERYSLFSWV